ncbi:MAG: CARDB domain-containing protein [Chloroflexota bacterium]
MKCQIPVFILSSTYLRTAIFALFFILTVTDSHDSVHAVVLPATEASPETQGTIRRFEGTLTPATEGGSAADTIAFDVTYDASGTPTRIDYTMTVSHLVITEDEALCAAGSQSTYTNQTEVIFPWQGGAAGYTFVSDQDFDGTQPTGYAITGLLGRTLKGVYIGPKHSTGSVQLFYEFDGGPGGTFTVRCFWTWQLSDGPGGVVSFSESEYDVREEAGSATITVVRDGIQAGEVMVDYATSNGTANDQDYTSQSGTLTFAEGETQKQFTIPIAVDDELEGPETVNLTLSNLTDGAIWGSPQTAVLTIDDSPDLGILPFIINKDQVQQQGNKYIVNNIKIFAKNVATDGATVPSAVVQVKHKNDVVHETSVGPLGPGDSKPIEFSWDVTEILGAGGGAASLQLNAIIDPANQIPETNDNNNQRPGGLYVDVKPVIVKIKPQYKLENHFFLDGTSVQNKIDVEVDWNGELTGKGSAPFGKVYFKLNENELSEPGTQMGGSHIYDMGSDFQGTGGCQNNVLQVWATGVDPRIIGQRDTVETTVLRVIPAVPEPKWAHWLLNRAPPAQQDNGFAAIPAAPIVNYIYNFTYPEPKFEAKETLPSWMPLVGGDDFGINPSQATAETTSMSSKPGSVAWSGEGGLDLIKLDFILSMSGTGETEFRCMNGAVILAFEESTLKVKMLNQFKSKQLNLRKILGDSLYDDMLNSSSLGWLAGIIGDFAIEINAEAEGEVEFTVKDIGDGEIKPFTAGVGPGDSDSGHFGVFVETSISDTWFGVTYILTGAGDTFVTMQAPANPSYLQQIGASIFAEFVLQSYGFDFTLGGDFGCSIPGGCSLSTVQAASQLNSPGWQPIQRDYAGPAYALFVPTTDAALLQASRQNSPVTINAETTLVSNIYPYPDSSLTIRNDGQRFLAYVHDDTSDPQGRGTEIRVLQGSDSGWNAPIDITADTQPDFNPALTLDKNENGVLVWERSTLPTEITPALDVTFTRSIEIYASSWNGASWNAPISLTNNGLMDYMPKLATGNDGTVMALWHTGDGVDRVGSASYPISLTHAIWDGVNWSTPLNAIPAQESLLDSALGVSTASEAAAVIVKGMATQRTANVLSATELYYSTYDGATWSVLQRLTSNTGADVAPALVYDSEGNRHLLWLQEDSLLWLKNSWNSADAQIIWPASAAGVVGNFRLSAGPNGQLAVVWPGNSDGKSSTAYMRYDPATNRWSAPNHLTTDVALDSAHAAAISASGDLHIGYNKTAITHITRTATISATQMVTIPNTPQLGQSDLNYVTQTPGRDLIFDSLTVTPSNPAPGEAVTVIAVLRNRGDLTALAPQVQIMAGTTAAPLQTLPDVAGGYSQTVQVNMVLPTTNAQHTLLAVADPGEQITEANETNNTISLTTTQPDLHIDLLYTAHSSQALSVTVQVVNGGALDINAPFAVTLYVGHPTTGTQLSSVNMPGLAAGDRFTLTQAADADTLRSVTENRLWAVVDDGDSVVEVDETNNAKQMPLAILPDLSLKGVDVTAGDGRMEVAVHNTGFVSATDILLWIAAGDQPPAMATATYSVTIPTITAAQTQTVTVAMPASNEMWSIKVDPSNTIAELNEGNNLAIRTLNIEDRSSEVYLPAIAR